MNEQQIFMILMKHSELDEWKIEGRETFLKIAKDLAELEEQTFVQSVASQKNIFGEV